MSFIKRVMDVIEVIGFDINKLNEKINTLTRLVNGIPIDNSESGSINKIESFNNQDSLSRDKFTSKINIENNGTSIKLIQYTRDFDGNIQEIK